VPTTVEPDCPPTPFTCSGAAVPARNTPRDIVEMLYRETSAALQTPNVQAQLAKLGVEPMRMT